MEKVMVALITPFTKENSVDYPALKKIIARLLKEGVDGFIVCGTTGETPTLKEEEKFEILSFVINETQHMVELWFGCGTNDTLESIRLCQKASTYDIDGVLLVTPYYNKPSQRGLYQHFHMIADICEKPIMLYNIPSRTGVQLTQQTIEKLLCNHANIIALKQACDDLDTVRYLKDRYPNFKIYSGEDGALDEGIDAGMDGLISVMAHINLKRIKQFIDEGRMDNKQRKQLKLDAQVVFLESSPSCIKYLLSRRKECENILRLPLCSVSFETQNILDAYDMF